jgi:type IV pilus assembly protein PilC
MPIFAYTAVTAKGRPDAGTVEAATAELAGEALLGRGVTPIEIRAAGGSFSIPSFGTLLTRFSPIRSRDLILFTKQLATMMRAGMPVLRMLTVLEEQTDNPRLRNVIHDISTRVQAGETLHGAFGRHRSVFPPLYVTMVNAGETSGALPAVLNRLIYILEHEERIRADVATACRYPLIVVAMLVMAFFVLLTFVIPKFAALFEQGNVILPLPTRICLALHHFLVSTWPLLLLATGGAIAGLRLVLKTPQGRYARDALVLRLPVFGSLIRRAVMSRFASIFAILQSSGVGILDTMVILRATLGNEAIGREFDRISDLLVEGQGIAGPLRSSRQFPAMVTNMIAIGEESGALDEMLREVAAHYDAEVEYATKGLSDALVPILTVGLAAVVLFFALAVFLPMWDLYKIVK